MQLGGTCGAFLRWNLAVERVELQTLVGELTCEIQLGN